MHWIYLMVAGLLEIGWAAGLKATEGFSRPWPVVFTILGMTASVFFLALAIQKIPLSTGYAIWTGIGAIGTAILGILVFSESASPARLGFIALILVGIVGLKLTSGP
jgi:quaternary ammonium compound-resistance protein SugE